MKSKKTIAIVLGAMCLALTLGISIQLKTVKGSNTIAGQNFTNDSLREEVLKYKEKYDNKYQQLEKAEKELETERQKSTENNSNLGEKEEEIKQGNKIVGMSEVTRTRDNINTK